MSTDETPRHFIRAKIDADNASGKYGGRVVTRFPPEPNGYLHIGHAKALCINFGLAEEYGGRCHLRFDDTNPTKEEVEYVEAIKDDIRWLGFDWGEHLYFASDYFERMAEDARELIRRGKAYVDELSLDEMRAQRGTVTEAGTNSPYRDRPAAESLALFEQMLSGGIAEGAATLRAKIDMADPNMKMRDPPFYRVMHATHHHVGDRWKAYPLYDYAHCLEDCYEGVTQSLCTLEFENNRELYDWYLAALGKEHRPEQTEFARLEMTHVMTSKRKLLALVQEGTVAGWDDPRMPTLAGLRRAGVRPEAIRAFIERVGVSKANSRVDYSLFEGIIRKDLEEVAPRVMGVVDPVELVLEDWPEGETDRLELPHHPSEDMGSREVPFGRRLWIEREDVAVEPPAGWRRMAPGWEIRLVGAYFVTCTRVETDADGTITKVFATCDRETRGGSAPDGRKPKGTIHWVARDGARPAEFRLYERLFAAEEPSSLGDDWRSGLNPESLVVSQGYIEPGFLDLPADARVQLRRMGYFWRDGGDSSDDALVLNRIATLKDSWARPEVKAPKEAPARRPKPAAEPPPPPVEAVLTSAEEALLSAAQAAGADEDSARSFIVNDLRRALGDAPTTLPMEGRHLAEILALLDADTISRAGAQTLLGVLLQRGGEPAALVDSLGLKQLGDTDALLAVIDEVLAAHPDEAARLRGGDKKLNGFFIGRVKAATGGKADPKVVVGLLAKRVAAT